jgi:S1-C subfamily serine protease
MINFKILSLAIFTLILLSINIGISYSQKPFKGDGFSTTPSQSLGTTSSANNLITTSPNPFLNNNQFLGNSQNFPSNNLSFPSSLPPLQPANNLITTSPNPFLNNTLSATKNINTVGSSTLSKNTNNDAILHNIYNLTASSVVQVTAFDSKNHSIFKTGSGFVYRYLNESAIVTVSNLLDGNNDITVSLADGSSYSSELTAYDPLTTLAVLSTQNIPQNKLIPLIVANSTNLMVGQTVLAIGNTMGYSNILTSGIISGLGKSIPAFGQSLSNVNAKIPNGIVTDLNLGNGYGGSPLLDIYGQVIGINIGNYTSDNTTTTSQSKNTGISFAVPSNSINKIIPSLLSTGYYSHPWLGAYGVDVDLDIARALGLNDSKGFLVISVVDSSPAKKAGILGGENSTSLNGRKITLGGDIILKVDNKYVQNIQDMSGYIENNKNIGDDMLVTLLRNGILQLIHVRLEANPNYFLPLK